MEDETNHKPNETLASASFGVLVERLKELSDWFDEVIEPVPTLPDSLKVIQLSTAYTREEQLVLFFLTGFSAGQTVGHRECMKTIAAGLTRITTEDDRHD